MKGGGGLGMGGSKGCGGWLDLEQREKGLNRVRIKNR